MGVNIKNDEAHMLAREISRLTGESMTTAVTEALKERLGRPQRGSREDFVARLLAIGRDCAAHLPEHYRALNPDDLLYDQHGLPHDCR